MATLLTAGLTICVGLACGPCLAQTATVPGEPKAPKMVALELGGKVLQSAAPLKPFDLYMLGFHPIMTIRNSRWKRITIAIR